MFFNDAVPSLTNSLRQEIQGLQGIGALRHEPSYTNQPASISLIDSFRLPREVSQFYFLDQFGWAEITPALVRHIFLAQKCDCAFFLRTPRVIAAISNPNTETAVTSLFGINGLNEVREAFKLRPREKEKIILEKLKTTMKAAGAPYFLPFPFRVCDVNSSRQHLIYLGKHPKGFEVMKDIMATKSSLQYAGVPVLGHTEGPEQWDLFSADPILALQEQLMQVFSGRGLNVGEVFSEHHVTNECYILRNYQEALRRLETSGAILVDPPAAERPKRCGIVTMSEDVRLTFQSKAARE